MLVPDTIRRISGVGRFSLVMTGVVFLATMMSAVACGGDGDGDSEPTGPAGVVSIEQALAAEEGADVQVKGALVATDTEVVLASALLESYPPQAGGAVVPVQGLDLAAIVGLSSTGVQGDLAQVSWTDYPVVLRGVMKGGVLHLEKAPEQIEAATTEVRVRFSPPGETPVSGDRVWWVLDVTNAGSSRLDLTFSSGQTAEVVLARDGVEAYRWSEGRAFTQAISTTTLEPAESASYVMSDIVSVAPGVYELTAWITASVGSGGGGGALPEIRGTLTVR